MSKQKYRLTYDTDKSKWDAFVERSPQGSVFSETWYLDALNVKYKILSVLNNNDEIVAGIVLAKNHINTWSNPMLDKYLGILLEEKQYGLTQKKKSEQFKIIELIALELVKYKSFDYYFHPGFTNWTPLFWNDFTQQTRYTYQIDLKNDIETIQKKFHGNLRNDIKNAINNNVVIKNNIQFDELYNIVNLTFKRQGSKAPFSQNKLKRFIEILTQRKKFISLGAYNNDGVLISACGIVLDNRSSYFLLNGIDIEKHIRGANALMILKAMEFIKEKEIEIFDFEGSMLPGVEQFYRRFGGDLVPYYRIWNDNFFNYFKSRAKKIYKKYRYGR